MSVPFFLIWFVREKYAQYVLLIERKLILYFFLLNVSVARTTFNSEFIAELEVWIDQMEDELPSLRNFILPVNVHYYSHSIFFLY